MDPSYVAANRDNWNDRVPIHVASQFYDVEGWLASPRGPRPREAALLGDVDGLSLIHLQCHFGLDTLGWAVAGARVVGLDFSDKAIAVARDLASRGGFADRARFVCADVHDAVRALDGETFDIVYVSLGALCWIPRVAPWAAQAAALVKPGGRLFMYEGHPLAWSLGEDEFVVEFSYFEEAEPYVDTEDTTYTDGDGRLANPTAYEWNHSLGEIVNAFISEGMRIDLLDEHDWDAFARFPFLIRVDDHRYELPPGYPRIPLSFTLMASKPV